VTRFQIWAVLSALQFAAYAAGYGKITGAIEAGLLTALPLVLHFLFEPKP
jgi:hypothetical protein